MGHRYGICWKTLTATTSSRLYPLVSPRRDWRQVFFSISSKKRNSKTFLTIMPNSPLEQFAIIPLIQLNIGNSSFESHLSRIRSISVGTVSIDHLFHSVSRNLDYDIPIPSRDLPRRIRSKRVSLSLSMRHSENRNPFDEISCFGFRDPFDDLCCVEGISKRKWVFDRLLKARGSNGTRESLQKPRLY